MGRRRRVRETSYDSAEDGDVDSATEMDEKKIRNWNKDKEKDRKKEAVVAAAAMMVVVAVPQFIL